MKKLEVYFDYICPFCLRGHGFLTELLPGFPGVEVEWRPCESHPRPGRFGYHSDLCIRGMYIALEQGADLMEYHRRMFQAAHSDRADLEDVSALMKVVDGLLDPEAFGKALAAGAYEDKLAENNQLAWETYAFPAVPSYRMNGALLKSIPGIGVTKKRLETFLRR